MFVWNLYFPQGHNIKKNTQKKSNVTCEFILSHKENPNSFNLNDI